MRTIIAPLLLVVVTACASSSGGSGAPPAGGRRQGGPRDSSAIPAAAPNTTARADLRDANGNSIGTITLTQTPRGVLLSGDLTTLPAGVHAVHVHDAGRCEPPFTSAGGHYNPMMRSHGFKSTMANHAGDLPNFLVAANGTGRVETYTRDLSLAPGAGTLLDGDGASIVVHAGPDDYTSDPAGNSGNRIACGVITR